ncbi:MAG: hypothetical protein LBD06_11740 [Candidatus Accumulibacter sp.]|nr:hypothetical protein [Accumulibacter sp.]
MIFGEKCNTVFRGQNLEKTEDRSVCGAPRRGMNEKPGARVPEDRNLRRQKTDQFAALRTGE